MAWTRTNRLVWLISTLSFILPGQVVAQDGGSWQLADLDGPIVCGNGVIEVGEDCDDGNPDSGDGCSDVCEVEPGYICSGQPSFCILKPFCGDGIIQPPEICDDGNPDNGDGCSEVCEVEPGYICNGQPSMCLLDPTEICLEEHFEASNDWTIFNVGALDWDWGRTDDGVCWSSHPDGTPAPNVTGSAGEAACIDSDAAGQGVVEAYLCSPQFPAGFGTINLRFIVNYQIFDEPDSDDFFNVLVGTAPPSVATIGSYSDQYLVMTNLGALGAPPGAIRNLELGGVAGQDIYVCFGYGANWDWYAQIDEVTVEASLSCTEIPDTDGDGVFDDIDNCMLITNPRQLDSNGDGHGNLCDPDLNNDCIVDAVDLNLLESPFFATDLDPNWDPDADFDGDNRVNVVDLGIMKSLFFMPPGLSAIGDCT